MKTITRIGPGLAETLYSLYGITCGYRFDSFEPASDFCMSSIDYAGSVNSAVLYQSFNCHTVFRTELGPFSLQFNSQSPFVGANKKPMGFKSKNGNQAEHNYYRLIKIDEQEFSEHLSPWRIIS